MCCLESPRNLPLPHGCYELFYRGFKPRPAMLHGLTNRNVSLQVTHKPSIGRYTTPEEPKARESLLMPSMRKSPSKASLSSTMAGPGSNVSSTTNKKPAPPTLLTVDVDAELSRSGNVNLEVPESAIGGLTPMVQAVNARLMERTPFAIDDAGDEDDDSEDEDGEGQDDNQVMDEVCADF